MPLTKRRTRLISFRVYEEEYEQLKNHCQCHGIRSISDMARIALDRLANDVSTGAGILEERIEALDGRVIALERRFDDLGG
jgi:uncharacterized protein YceH (UPF0502 family)